MAEPIDLSESELTQLGLGVVRRRSPAGEAVIRFYCLRCGIGVLPERRKTDPSGWWACARGCNTLYADAGHLPATRPTT